jgi:hypothetical protein
VAADVAAESNVAAESGKIRERARKRINRKSRAAVRCIETFDFIFEFLHFGLALQTPPRQLRHTLL